LVAKGDARRAADKWLKDQGIIQDLTDEQYSQVRQLIGNPSFGIFWALLRFRREESAIMLSNAQLGGPERDCAASVLQGNIKAIDGVRDLILELAEPTDNNAAEQGSNLNG
jgi:hypothetical protein